MTHAYQIVAKVLRKFRGLPKKLAAMNGKSHQWYSSHGIEPKTVNPLSSGNVSEVEHYMRFARKYEACELGAGQMLNTRVHEALCVEFGGIAETELSQNDLHSRLIDEGCDVHKWLINFDFHRASRTDLVRFTDECDELVDVVAEAKSKALAILKHPAMNVGNNGGK